MWDGQLWRCFLYVPSESFVFSCAGKSLTDGFTVLLEPEAKLFGEGKREAVRSHSFATSVCHHPRHIEYATAAGIGFGLD